MNSRTDRQTDCLQWRHKAIPDNPKSITWEWEDPETGLIRTFEIALPNLDIEDEDDSSEVREIILDRKLRLDRDEIPVWIEIIPERKPN